MATCWICGSQSRRNQQASQALEPLGVALVRVAAGPCTIAYPLRELVLFTDLFRTPEVAAQLFAMQDR